MSCPVCNHLNDAMSVRCVECGTVLIHEAAGHSSEYRKAAAHVDSRIAGGACALVGFLTTALVLKFVFPDFCNNDRELVIYSFGGAVLGRLLGRLTLKSRRPGS